MDNPISALLAALGGVPGVGPFLVYAPVLIALAAVLAAVLPVPAPDSPWAPARRLLDLVAMNFGAARNARSV
jgi:hypothetical protein